MPGLFLLLQSCQILLDLGNAVVIHMVLTVGNHQGRCALDAVLQAQILVVVSDQLLISDTGLTPASSVPTSAVIPTASSVRVSAAVCCPTPVTP